MKGIEMTIYRKFAVLSMALFFALSLGGVAVAKGMNSLKGEVVSVDTVAKTVTVKASETTTSSPSILKGEVPFATTDMTKFSMGKKHETLASLKAGDLVKVVYHEKDGKKIADHIVITSRPASK